MIDLLKESPIKNVGVNSFKILRKSIKTLLLIVVIGSIVIIWNKYGSTMKNVLSMDMKE